MRVSNPEEWTKQLLSEPASMLELEKIFGKRVGSLIDKIDEINERKIRTKKIEAMRDLKKVERVKPSLFRKMETICTKEEIFAFTRKNKGRIIKSKKQEEINEVVTNFCKELWKNRKGSRYFSERRCAKLKEKIKKKHQKEKNN